MRTANLFETGRSFDHVISRVVDPRMVFGPKDKEVFCEILRSQEAFSGVRVITH
jgi:hypothetical protein